MKVLLRLLLAANRAKGVVIERMPRGLIQDRLGAGESNGLVSMACGKGRASREGEWETDRKRAMGDKRWGRV